MPPTKDNQQTIQTTAAEVEKILRQRGVLATDPITVTITTDPRLDLLMHARSECRARVVAAGLSDDDIDHLIEEARTESASET